MSDPSRLRRIIYWTRCPDGYEIIGASESQDISKISLPSPRFGNSAWLERIEQPVKSVTKVSHTVAIEAYSPPRTFDLSFVQFHLRLDANPRCTKAKKELDQRAPVRRIGTYLFATLLRHVRASLIAIST